MRLDDFDFELPRRPIAEHLREPREAARLLPILTPRVNQVSTLFC